MKIKFLFTAAALVAVAAFTTSASAATVSLISGGIADGNGDFNYEGGGSVSGVGTATPGENIPRDRYLIGSPNVGATLDVEGWTMRRLAYSGGNNAFGLDGNFGFDDAAFEPANTGSGQAFTNGNENTIVDLIADTIAYSGVAGDIINLSYLLGSDSNSGAGSANSTVTLTLDAGLGSEQTITFATQTRTGTARDGSTDVSEVYVSTGAFSTVDLTLQMNPVAGSTRSLIDDVRLTVDTVVPEPSTFALTGLAFAASMVMVRKRK